MIKQNQEALNIKSTFRESYQLKTTALPKRKFFDFNFLMR